MAWLVGVYLRETRRVNEDGTVVSLALRCIRGAAHILRALDLRESPKFFDVIQPAD